MTDRAPTLREAAQAIADAARQPDEGINDHFERLAEAFHKETGIMAPGKSEPLLAPSHLSSEERMAAWDAWDAWNRKRIEDLRVALAITPSDDVAYYHAWMKANAKAALADELAEALDELADLMEAVREKDYTPDTFTTQPASVALVRYKEARSP